MADHHLLHFPPSNDLKLRGRAQHEPPNKALLRILRIRRTIHVFVSKNAGRVTMALGGVRAMLLELLSKKSAAGFVEMRRKIKRKQRGKTNNDKDPPCCFCGCAEMDLSLLPPSWSSSSSSSRTTAVLEPLEPGSLHYSYYGGVRLVACWQMPAELHSRGTVHSAQFSRQTDQPNTPYDPSWDTETIPPELQLLPPIAGYLERPDEEYGITEDDDDGDGEEHGGGYHEIDSLAERFIARCHERFMLEKQESCRRYQEMLARTMRLTEMT